VSVNTLFPVLVRRSRTVSVSLIILGIIGLISVVGPYLTGNDYLSIDLYNRFLSPTMAAQRYFGTDDLGRDLFSRTLMGVRVTLVVAVIASFVSLFIGVLYGAIAGYLGGKVDAIMMRSVDALYALPFIFLVIVLMVVF
jgi:oligopeptide transport system permease protein